MRQGGDVGRILAAVLAVGDSFLLRLRGGNLDFAHRRADLLSLEGLQPTRTFPTRSDPSEQRRTLLGLLGVVVVLGRHGGAEE